MRTDQQDLAAQRETLLGLGVAADRIYLDHGLTGTKKDRPGLREALAAVRGGDTLVVPKLDRLARSVPDAREIGDSLAARGVSLSLGGNVYDPTDPMGKMFFNILATFAECGSTDHTTEHLVDGVAAPAVAQCTTAHRHVTVLDLMGRAERRRAGRGTCRARLGAARASGRSSRGRARVAAAK
jgi:hypothetical protein